MIHSGNFLFHALLMSSSVFIEEHGFTMIETILTSNASDFSSDKLLRTQVYEYLRTEIIEGSLEPGMFISMNVMTKKLDITRTPLRDALLQLQSEGFVSFLPQRGIKINELDQKGIENLYEILGATDSRVLLSVFDKMTPKKIGQMKQINQKMHDSISDSKIYKYFDLNMAFHNVYLSLSSNLPLRKLIEIIRQRLFVFGKNDWSQKMMELNYDEHLEFLNLLEQGDANRASNYIRDTHCNYQLVQDTET